MLKFKEGQVYRCIKSSVDNVFTVDKLYPVTKNLNGELVIHSDGGIERTEKFINNLTLIDFELEGGNKMLEFKEGQVYEYLANDCYPFGRGKYLTVQSDDTGCYVLSRGGRRWYDHEFRDGDLRLVEEPTPDPTSDVKPVFINVENLIEHIVTNKLEVNEILSYLDGYVEGSRY